MTLRLSSIAFAVCLAWGALFGAEPHGDRSHHDDCDHGHAGCDHGHAAAPIFAAGAPPKLGAMPEGRLRDRLAELPLAARRRALATLAEAQVGTHDLPHLRVDGGGGVLFVCDQAPPAEPAVEAADEPATAGASTQWDDGFSPSGSVPIDSPPVFESHPGAPNTLYLDFNGDTITGTAWNSHFGKDTITARPFNLDSKGNDPSVFEEAEQRRIYQVWQRVSEDLAPFDINVTTDPTYDDRSNRGPRVGQVLFTHRNDTGGGGGGVAYIGVFGRSNYVNYQPAWAYYNAVSERADYLAEVGSHEFGHNIGLNHDGNSSTTYYRGHGSGATSWAPLMGAGYGRNVSQWSNGEYHDANQTQDDQAYLVADLGYRSDDHGDSAGDASFLAVDGGTTISRDDGANQGIILNTSDVDVFGFTTGAGTISLRVDPFVVGTQTRGGNLDVALRLLDASGSEIAAADPASTTYAELSTTVAEGTYYLEVRGVGVGDPSSSSPTGYVARHSTGQFFVSGTVVDTTADTTPPSASLTAGDVTTGGGSAHSFTVTYSDATAVDVGTIDDSDIRVTGPNGYDQTASLVAIDVTSDGTPRTATYRVPAAGGTWDDGDNGTYPVALRSGQVADTPGNLAAATTLGSFSVAVPAPTPPEITSASTGSGRVGEAFSYRITGTNSPTSFGASALPPGLSVDAGSGVIDGDPTTAGTYESTITAANADGSDSERLTITIDPADTTPPASTATELIIGGQVASDVTSLTVDGDAVAVDGSGRFRATVSLPDGGSTVSLIATDDTGHSTTREIDVTSTAAIPAVGN